MTDTLGFSELVRLIDERSTAFRDVIGSAPNLGAQVPSCPEWTLLDLAQHIGSGRRRWAAIVAAGPADAPPADAPQTAPGAPDAPTERVELLGWLAESTELLLSALREAGPEKGCWTWWDQSVSPQTSGAVARHQLQQLAVHTYDAQLTVGAPQPLPDAIALDGVDEFLVTCVAGEYRWPHQPCTIDYVTTEGPAWRLTLSADSVRIAPPGPGAADASVLGTANELVMFLYGRIPMDALKVDGDGRLFDLLAEWDPDA